MRSSFLRYCDLEFCEYKKKYYREWGKKNKRNSYISQNCDDNETKTRYSGMRKCFKSKAQ